MLSRSPAHSLTLVLITFLGLVSLLWLLAGCSGEDTPQTAPEADATPSAVEATPATAMLEPATEASPVPAEPGVITLTWWTPPSFSPVGDDEASQLVAANLERFTEANPSLVVQPVQKAPYGEGGLLDYLLTTQKVVPALLPDLLTLSGEEIAVAQRAGLLQPLDNLLSADLLADLYPFALEEGRLDGEMYGVQFEADIEHVAYNTGRMASVPRTWADVLDANRLYLFPTGSESNPGDAFLTQYMAAGGELGGRNAPIVLDESALFDVLSFYEQGRKQGTIPATVLGLDTAEATWPPIVERRADIGHVLASRYLAERDRSPDLAFGPIPTRDDTPATISRGWTLAIVTDDPERQAAAVRLVESLLDAELNSQWAQASNRLPARRTALSMWDQQDPYTSFLHWQLEAAAVRPSGSSYLEAARIMSEAQRSVLNGTASAQEATEQATGIGRP